MPHDKVTWKERHAWAWENSKLFPATPNVITAIIGNLLVVGFLVRQGSVDKVQDLVIRFLATTCAAFVLTPLTLYAGKLLKAPRAILGERLVDADRRQKLAERERDSLIAENAAALRPNPRIWFTKDGKVTKLNVRNMGAAAVFHANSMVLWANTGRGEIGHAQRLRWDRAAGAESKIVTGGEDNCIVAAVETEVRPITQVTLQAICESPFGAHQPSQVYWSANWLPEATGIEPSRPCALCEITVTAEPEMLDGPIRKRFQLGPGGFHEDGSEGFEFDAQGRLRKAPPAT